MSWSQLTHNSDTIYKAGAYCTCFFKNFLKIINHNCFYNDQTKQKFTYIIRQYKIKVMKSRIIRQQEEKSYLHERKNHVSFFVEKA